MTDEGAELKTPERQRDYARGYAAGRKRAATEDRAEIAAAMREDFTQRMMLAIAAEIIRSPWGTTVDGKFVPNRGADPIMATVRRIAEAAARKCTFIPPNDRGDPS